MVQAIISSKVLYNFLTHLLDVFQEGDLLEIENGKISCVFDSANIEHKGSGYFEYSKSQFANLKTMISKLGIKPLNLEFHEKQIKLIID